MKAGLGPFSSNGEEASDWRESTPTLLVRSNDVREGETTHTKLSLDSWFIRTSSGGPREKKEKAPTAKPSTTAEKLRKCVHTKKGCGGGSNSPFECLVGSLELNVNVGFGTFADERQRTDKNYSVGWTNCSCAAMLDW